MVRLGTLLRRTPRDKDKPENAPVQPAFLGPPLMVLIPDVAGVSSFRLYDFSDAEGATSFVTSLSRQQRERAHAFWALQDEPSGVIEGEDTAGEATVLIRASEGSDLVYVVSFVDIESAQSFARFEVKRGMHLGLMLVYWASMVNVVSTDDGVQLIPEFPPRIDKRLQHVQATPPRLRRETEPALTESEGAVPQTNGRKPPPAETATQAEDGVAQADPERQAEEMQRLKEEAEEHRRIAAEAEELRRLLAEEEEKQRAAEEQRRLAEAEEQRRADARAEEQAAMAAAAALEEQRRLDAEAEEQRRLEAEAQARQLREEQRKLAAEAEEQRRLEAEAEEARQLEAEAEEQRRLGAEAEEQRLAAEADEQRRLDAEAEEQRQVEAGDQEEQLAAEAEAQQRLAAEAGEQRRIEVEADQQRRLEAEAEDQRRVEAEAEDQRRLAAQAEEWRRQAEAEEQIRRSEEERASFEAEAKERLRAAAQAQAERDVATDAEMQRLREAVEQEQRRIDAETEALPAGEPAFDPLDPETQETLAGAQAFEQESEIAGGSNAEPPAEPPNAIEELLQQDAQRRVQIPSQFAKNESDSAPATEDDPNIADEVNKILRRRRWEKRDSPFEGFNSPPGRF